MTDLNAIEERVRQGDPIALGEFGEHQREALRAYVEKRLGTALRSKIESDDLIQETLAEAIRALPMTQLNGRSVFGWLCHLAEQRIIDAHRWFFAAEKRDAKREVAWQSPRPSADGGEASFLPLLAASLTTPSQAYSRNIREARIQQALAALTESDRVALRLRYVENLPSKEIAARIGRTDAATRVMLTRALKRLQEAYETT